MRPKNTSRAEARRRYRDEQRQLDAEAEGEETAEAVQEAAPERRSMFAMPDFGADLRSLPMVFRKPLVWLPFGLLVISAAIVLAWDAGVLPDGQVTDILFLYVQLTLPPTSLFVFFIGGFVAPRASYMVGAILGAFDALLISVLSAVAPSALAEVLSGNADITADEAGVGDLTVVWGMAIFVGIFAAGFAAWYRRFLRSSQERAAANRAAREREQAEKAKQQAREDKAALRAQKHADRESRRKSGR